MNTVFDIQQAQQFDNLEFLAKSVVEGFITGLHRSPYHGFSVEFAEHRIYNKGESTRHIDWKLFARTERLFVKRYEEETNLRCQLVIDTSSSMLFAPTDEKNPVSKLQFAVYTAAALIHLLRKQRDAVGLTLFANDVTLHTDQRLSVSHIQRLYTELAATIATTHDKTQPTGTSIANTLHQVSEQLHTRSLVILFTDMFEAQNSDTLLAALQHLRYNKHEVLVCHITDHKLEQEFKFDNRPYKFIDLETGEQLKLHPNEIRDHYLHHTQKYLTEIKQRCQQYHIDFIEADCRAPFAEVLLAYLIKRNKLY